MYNSYWVHDWVADIQVAVDFVVCHDVDHSHPVITHHQT